MSGSIARTERIGPIPSGIAELNPATKRVISPSGTSSNTTSAESSPVWGRASGVFSILIESAGRRRLSPLGSGSPVSGATVGLGVVGATRFLAVCPPPPQAASATSRKTVAIATTRFRFIFSQSVLVATGGLGWRGGRGPKNGGDVRGGGWRVGGEG